MFQQVGAEGLLHGQNRTPVRISTGRHGFHGPGVVDANNRLTVGLPYPPLSLLLALPGCVLGGDSCGYRRDVASATLMLLSGPAMDRSDGGVAPAAPRILL
jgi:hypothetical protein